MSSSGIRYADYLGWTFTPAVIASVIFLATDFLLVFNLLRCKVPPARSTFYVMIAWATLRSAGMICRALSTTDQLGSNLGLFITTAVLISVALFPLLRTLIANLLRVHVSVDNIKRIHGLVQASQPSNVRGRQHGNFKHFQSVSSMALLVIIVVLISGVVWILNTPAGVAVDPTATTLRLAGTWALAVFTWIQFFACVRAFIVVLGLPKRIRSETHLVANSIILIFQSVMLIIRTIYGLYAIGAIGTVALAIPEGIYYSLGLVTELLYVVPFLIPKQVEKMEPVPTESQKEAQTGDI
ncbi:uncharacterized protein BJ171DRAFT_578463 [Polychytrium aggregatum]|uniref:uncharacterized protein n=1 Tax=Polychytrium aggregatum TaxID=110093 RepID=UPI0022FF1E22|nr:uncharacterized protein BJ171DRAFT_578463 [Polychytrium aggregatum]KAI9207990.1 hypothetical protein BJ171DRAFT_578463 [Polychytrium aggregatum]